MLSSESLPLVNAPQHRDGYGIVQGCRPRLPQPRKSAHSSHCNYDCQDTRPHRAIRPRSPERRQAGDARRELPLIVDVAVVYRGRRPSIEPQSCGIIHRMPPEILRIVFENCFDEQTTSRTALSHELPLLLGRVCSYWRSVAQTTPRLWTFLSLRFLETNVDRSHDSVKVATAVDTWLHRSHPSPLSIAFTDHRIFQKDTEDVVVGLLNRICIHAHRWKAIHLKFSSDYFVRLGVLSSCAFTSLTAFSLHVDHMGWRRSLLSLHFDLAQATRLTSLAYTGPDHVIREDVLVNWERLTSVAFSYDLHEAGGESATLPRHFSKLALCQNLTELAIGLNTTLAQHAHQLDVLAQGQTIELPKLRTLRIRRLSRTAHACALLDALRLPQLSTLHVDSAVISWDRLHTTLSHPDVHAQTQWWHAHHLSALLDRSGCHLDTLHICNVDMSPSELARLLTSPSTSPTLSMFTFEPCPRAYPISDVLAHLVPVPGSESTPASSFSGGSSPTLTPGRRSPAFPSLTHLRLGCAHEAHLGPIANLFASRTGDRATHTGIRPLAVFELVFHDFVYSHGQGRQGRRKACFDAFRERVLKCAREGGVDVDIRVERPYEPIYLSVPSSSLAR